MENATRRIPYVFNILERTLRQERQNLEIWNQRLTSDDPLTVRQAQGNIPSNENRVQQLEEVLTYLRGTNPGT